MNTMKKQFLFSLILVMAILPFAGCEDDDENPSPNTPIVPVDTTMGEVLIDITNIIDDSIGLRNVDVSGGTTYYNSFGEPYTVTKLKYYVSNIQLMRADTVAFTMPESYFLIKEDVDSTKKLVVPGVPSGSYDGVRFMIGVDSTRNVSGAQTGALTQSDMFWTWVSGYIFFKLEGTSPLSPDGITYHVGGFRESNNTNAIRVVDIEFDGNELEVAQNREAEIHLFANINKLFDAIHPISISSNSFIMSPGGDALLIADNISKMFIFDHIHN